MKKCLKCKTEIRIRTAEEMPQCIWLDKLDFTKENCECGRCMIGWM